MVERPRIVIALAALALLAAACNSGQTTGESSATGFPPSISSPTETTSPTESTSPTETSTPTEMPSPTPAPELEDGRHFGFIQSVDTAAMTMVFDLAYFLMGDETNQAAADHGDETPVPNDYYIVNDNPRLRTLPLAPDVRILVIDWTQCCEPVPGELGPFAESFTRHWHKWNDLYQGGDVPYWLTVEHGAVVAIEQQYLP
jgi:hypothetical protein